ncbi:MAG: MarR family transcriptional regulator [Cyanobacteriota bacterium]
MKESLKFDRVEDSLGFKIAVTHLGMKQLLSNKLKENGLDFITPEQMAILLKLYEIDGLYQKELADNLTKHKPNITRMVDILEEKKLIIRQADGSDRRKYRLHITNKGIKAVEDIRPLLFNLLSKVFYNFDDQEIEKFKTYLDRLFNNLGEIENKQE